MKPGLLSTINAYPAQTLTIYPNYGKIMGKYTKLTYYDKYSLDQLHKWLTFKTKSQFSFYLAKK